MPVRVVLDHPHRYIGRRLMQRVRALAGAGLIALGTAAWVVAIPCTLALAAWVFDDQFDLVLPSGADVSDEVMLAWGAAVTCIFLGLRGRGRRLIGRERRLVLFLRRFGFTDATRAVTYAIASTLGGNWRLVTLDDAEVAPVTVSGATTSLLRVATVASHVVHGVPPLLARAYSAVMYVMCGVLVLELVRARVWDRTTMDLRNFTPYLDIVTSVADGRLPYDAVRPDLPGVFAAVVLPIAFVVISVVPRLTTVPWWAWAALAAALFLLSRLLASSRIALSMVERTRVVPIRREGDIAPAADALSAASFSRVGARLSVLRVATPVWQQAVSRFASAASVALIDVSDPSEHVIWEIEELLLRRHTRCLFIGHHERVALLAEDTGAAPADPAAARLASLLEWEEILAYSTDARGLKRFARALRNTLRGVGAHAAPAPHPPLAG